MVSRKLIRKENAKNLKPIRPHLLPNPNLMRRKHLRTESSSLPLLSSHLDDCQNGTLDLWLKTETW